MGDPRYIRQALEYQTLIVIRAFTTQLQRLCSNGLTIELLCLLLYNHGLPRSFACLLNLFPLQRLYVTVAKADTDLSHDFTFLRSSISLKS